MARRGKLLGILIAAMALSPIVTHAFSDPTRPADFIRARPSHAVPSDPPAPVLQSTLVSPQRRLAVIDGKRLRIGDRFNGAVITEISQYEVRMKKGGRVTTLRLLPQFTKEPERVQ